MTPRVNLAMFYRFDNILHRVPFLFYIYRLVVVDAEVLGTGHDQGSIIAQYRRILLRSIRRRLFVSLRAQLGLLGHLKVGGRACRCWISCLVSFHQRRPAQIDMALGRHSLPVLAEPRIVQRLQIGLAV